MKFFRVNNKWDTCCLCKEGNIPLMKHLKTGHCICDDCVKLAKDICDGKETQAA